MLLSSIECQAGQAATLCICIRRMPKPPIETRPMHSNIWCGVDAHVHNPN